MLRRPALLAWLALPFAACGSGEKELAQLVLPSNVTTCLNDSFASTSSRASSLQLCLFLEGTTEQAEDTSASGMACALATSLPICSASDANCSTETSWLCDAPSIEVEEGDTLGAELFLVRGDAMACAGFSAQFDRANDQCEGSFDDEDSSTCLAKISFEYTYQNETLVPSQPDAVRISHSGFVWETLGDFANTDTTDTSALVCPEITAPPPAERCPGTSCTPVPLIVSMEGEGTGEINNLPGDFSCEKTERGTQTCNAQFPTGRQVKLTAEATNGAVFASWGEPDCDADPIGECTVLLTEPSTLKPTFGFALSLTVQGRGVVTSMTPGFDGDGIQCRAETGDAVPCPEVYVGGETVTLLADDTDGWTFAGWTGADCLGAQCTVSMTEPVSVTATFGHRINIALVGEGMVTSTPSAIMCPGSCDQAFQPGTDVTLTAFNVTDQTTFYSWQGACEGQSDPSCALGILTGSLDITASFGYDLRVEASGPGTITRDAMGIACDSAHPDCRAYLPSTQVTLTATPDPGQDPGARFLGWSDPSCGQTALCTVTMDQARTVTASFEATYDLTLNFQGVGAGQVDITPSVGMGSVCVAGGPCTETFSAGTQLTLVVSPGPNAYFAQFSGGGCSGRNACQITMDQARTVTVELIEKYDLTVTLIGAGAGQVDLSPAPLPDTGAASCTMGSCTVSYAQGTAVTLTQSAAQGSGFDQWEQACTGAGACTVTMNSDQTVLARFVVERVLTLNFAGQGAGTATLDPPNRSCASAAACTETYNDGAVVTITAAADGSSAFGSWTAGPCTGSTNPVCVVTMNQDVTAEATLVPLRDLTVSFGAIVGQGSGSVEVTAPGQTPQTCASPTACNLSYSDGTQVTLTAMSAGGSAFDGWAGACLAFGSNPVCTLTLSQSESVTTNFIREYQLTVAFLGQGSGQVQLTPPGAVCTQAPCNQIYTHGTQVTLTPTPNGMDVFSGWTGVCAAAGTGPCSLTMTSAMTAGVQFSPPDSTVTAVLGGDGQGTIDFVPGAGSCSAAQPQNCAQLVPFGGNVTLFATPQGGNTFAGWVGCPAPSGSSCPLTNVTANISVTALFFVRKQLTLDLTGDGRGSVTVNPGTNCAAANAPALCPNNTYDHGTSVTLTAAAENSSTRFLGWTGICAPSGVGPCNFQINQDETVSAIFEETGVDLTITGTGMVNLVDMTTSSTITCSTPGCFQVYDLAEMVTLTATSATQNFSAWTGDCAAEATNVCSLTINQAHSVGVSFQ